MSVEHYPLFIDGVWQDGSDDKRLNVLDPATEALVATFAVAGPDDVDRAAVAAGRAFSEWRFVPAHERAKLLREAARNLAVRTSSVAERITREQGKPLREARAEVERNVEFIEWYADEGRRAYGRLIPPRQSGVSQIVLREPVGPVAAFAPWNFPLSQVTKKVAAALAAGCTVVLKAPEEAPGAAVELARAFAEAGLPAGALNLVYGDPPTISSRLIPHPAIRAVSFTGSVSVGKALGELAAAHVKPITLELGGHAPVLVLDDVDVSDVAGQLARAKYRNAGQVCVSPTRFLVQRSGYEAFVDRFAQVASSLKTGGGFEPGSDLGPLTSARRLAAVDALVADARARGAHVRTGGQRIGNRGHFYAPTVLTDVPDAARILHEEPFGPVAVIAPIETLDEGISRANASAYGLAGYVFTHSSRHAQHAVERLEVGMVGVNQLGLGAAENPFGGVKESGHGRESGIEGLDAFLISKFVAQSA